MPQVDQPVEAQFIRDFVKRWAGLVSAGNIDALLAASTDDIVFIDAAFPQPFHGKDAVRSVLQNIFGAFPDLRYEPVSEPFVSVDGSAAATRVHFTGTMQGPLDPPGFAPTGQRVDFSGMEFFEFKDTKVQRVELLFNAMDLGAQIGAAPAPGSALEKLGVRLQRLQARLTRRRSGR